jgi:signal transduction histidine kinase
LRSQLEAQLEQMVGELETRIDQRKSDLLLLAENEPIRLALLDSFASDVPPPPFVQRVFGQMTGFNRITIRDREGRVRWTLDAPGLTPIRSVGESVQRADFRGVDLHLPITDLVTGDTIGNLEASVRAALLVPDIAVSPPPGAAVSALFIPNAGPIVPPTVDERLFHDESVEWAGHRWLSIRRLLTEPAVDLVIAGALDPYVDPFERTARSSAAVLLAASILVVAIIVALTQRMTREINREFAQREALAAVGEFASELAHEVRNPLTAIRLDLQRVEEAAADEATVRGIVPRVLRHIERLDRAVSGALRVARGGSTAIQPVELGDVLESARRAAEPEFNHRRATLNVESAPAKRIELDGDAGALEQMFLNVLINAAHALSPGGEARVVTSERDGVVEVTVTDNGGGMTPQQLERVQEPFRSTKRDGTGLGLKIARRIAAGHRGELVLESGIGQGTTVRVTLPRRTEH